MTPRYSLWTLRRHVLPRMHNLPHAIGIAYFACRIMWHSMFGSLVRPKTTPTSIAPRLVWPFAGQTAFSPNQLLCFQSSAVDFGVAAGEPHFATKLFCSVGHRGIKTGTTLPLDA